ncbi:hypothetical protein Tco_0747700 [Tanacetum coccineum]|uniref:MAK10-like protein n=1 Tax=Tanacetum coccineum TaxID=301880 RepID=A0ABQ4YTG7_9ASTR
MGDVNLIRTLEDYSKPSHEGYRNTFELPVGNNVLEQPKVLPQDVSSTSDRHLIELENQVQCLMEAHLALTQPTQVNKITTLCEIFSGPHETQYCMDDSEQAYVDYASSRAQEMGGRKFTLNQGPRNFNKTSNTWKEKQNFNWAHSQTITGPQNRSIFVHSFSYQMKLEKAILDFDSNQEKRLSHLRTQLGQQQDDMIGKINLLWKTVSEKLNDVSTPENIGNSISHKSIAAISHDKREELRKKGIKSPSKLFSPKYLSPASIKELNKNPSAPKHVYFVNSIVILSKDNDTKEGVSTTNIRRCDLSKMTRGNEEVKEQGNGEDEIETNVEVKEVIEEEESEFETDEEVEEILEEEEEDEDDENFNLFPTMKELSHHEWFAYECDFMILEDTTSIIDRCLGEMVFGRPFIDKTGLVYDKEEGTVIFDEKKIGNS